MMPLAEKLRPQSFDDVVGQESVTTLLAEIMQENRPFSLLFWGPPGCGKTTLGRIVAKHFDRTYMTFSGSYSSSVEMKKVLTKISETPLQQRVLFIDEIHRFNRAQQDIFLPYLESGAVILIGATTENPSFALNDALLSRLRVFELAALNDTHLAKLLDRACDKFDLKFSRDAAKHLIQLSAGDGRHFFNLIENIVIFRPFEMIDLEQLTHLVQKRPARYDKHQDQHYNLISALHKSVRGSDPDAALYYLARMLKGGEDPNYLARRLLRMASEDIGLADPQALSIVLNAWQGYERMGSPEGDLLLAQATIYLALAPKSNAAYTAYKRAESKAIETSHLDPPKHILNAPTSLMKNLDYGKDYIYDHDTPEGCAGQSHFPEGFEESFYQPVPRGFEREMLKRLNYFKKYRMPICRH